MYGDMYIEIEKIAGGFFKALCRLKYFYRKPHYCMSVPLPIDHKTNNNRIANNCRH